MSDFNIKFYEYDSITHLPKAEIYSKNIIVSPKNKSYKMQINLDSLNIKIPKNGICIGLEIINTTPILAQFQNSNPDLLLFHSIGNHAYFYKNRDFFD